MKNWRIDPEKCSWLLKLGIWLLLILWAAQGSSALKGIWDSGASKRAALKIGGVQAMREADREFSKFTSDLLNKSLFDNQYNFKKYYADLKSIKLENKRLYNYELADYQRVVNLLSNYVYNSHRWILMYGYENAKEKAFAEQEAASKEYAEWLQTADIHKSPSDESLLAELHGTNKKKDFEKDVADFFRSVWKWFLVLYARGLLLVFFLYLIKMKQWRGILETTLADKKKFLLAVICWPVFIFIYPFNVVREIRVEAELRRMGKAFRRFSPAENEFVRRIANSAHYKEWLTAYRLANEGRFQRTLLFAVFVTLSVHALSPLIARADQLVARDGPGIVRMAGEDDQHKDQVKKFDSYDDPPDRWCLPSAIAKPPLLIAERCTWFVDKVARSISCKKIHHVPLYGSQVRVEVILLT